MGNTRLTDNHFCYVLFLEMSPADFIALMKTNGIVDNMKFLDSKSNFELYQEAKDLITDKVFGQVEFDFDYDIEPFVFKKYINGKFDREYKICVFEYGEEKNYAGQTSKLHFDGMPVFYDQQGNVIKNSLN